MPILLQDRIEGENTLGGLPVGAVFRFPSGQMLYMRTAPWEPKVDDLRSMKPIVYISLETGMHYTRDRAASVIEIPSGTELVVVA